MIKNEIILFISKLIVEIFHQVEVLKGRDKGKQGLVQMIIQERNWVIVEGLNTKLVSLGKTKKFPGIYILEEQPLLVTTDVALVDPSDMLV